MRSVSIISKALSDLPLHKIWATKSRGLLGDSKRGEKPLFGTAWTCFEANPSLKWPIPSPKRALDYDTKHKMITEPNFVIFELILVIPVLELPNRIVLD